MSTTPFRIGAFAVAMALVFGLSFAAGRIFGGEDEEPASYSLRLTAGGPAESTRISFSVVRDHEVVTDFATRHEKKLHLIAVRKDFGGYRHLHPAMDADGTWSVTADLVPGEWRVFADFQQSGQDAAVVHDDVVLAGEQGPTPPSPGSVVRQSVDGYDVDLAWAGTGAERQAVFTISRGGRPVTDLEPYLGAYGHLVVLSDPDLGFEHVHPEEGPSGPTVAFATGLDRGDYRLYVEFQHEGKVRTVPFAATVAGVAADHEDGGHGDH